MTTRQQDAVRDGQNLPAKQGKDLRRLLRSLQTTPTTPSGSNSANDHDDQHRKFEIKKELNNSQLPLKKRRRSVATKGSNHNSKSRRTSVEANNALSTHAVAASTSSNAGKPKKSTSLSFGSALSDDTPNPPPLVRAPTGQSTAYNTYHNCAATTTYNTSGPLFVDSLSDFTWSGTKETPSPSTALALEKQRRLEDCLALQNAVPPPVTATNTTRDILDFLDDKKPSPAKGNAESLGSLAMIPPTVSSDIMEDTASQEKEEQEQATLPASMLKGKLIPTPQGLAMLLHPKETMSAASYSVYISSASDPGSITRNKRWTRAEDEHLKYAVAMEAGPPHNWKEIARTYFPATRNGNQCKQRWKKINPAANSSKFTAEEDKIILESEQAGLSFSEISKKLSGRSAEKVRLRFVQALDPSRKRDVEWTEQEDGILHLYQGLWGNKWTDIAKKLPGRTDNDVKNRWYGRKNQSERKLKMLTAESERRNKLADIRANIMMSDAMPSPPDDDNNNSSSSGGGDSSSNNNDSAASTTTGDGDDGLFDPSWTAEV